MLRALRSDVGVQKRRLAIVSSHPIQYNAPVFRALAARGDLDVHVFFSWQGTQLQPDVDFGHVITWDIPLTEGYGHSFVKNVARRPGTQHFMGLHNPGMCRAIAEFRPDAVLVYGWSSWTHLSVLRHFHTRVPVFFRGDSTLLSSDRWWKARFRKHVLAWVYRHIDRALYVGRRNREYFLAHGVPETKLSWAPHSVDNDRFSGEDAALQAEAEDMRAALGIPQPSLAFLFAGKLVPRKQPGLLISSFRSLLEKRADILPQLLLVGTGPLETELRAQSEGLNNVHFLGFKNQSKMPATYRMGDVFVLPSSRETWGLAVNEAMACGRPVIVSHRVGCAPDLAGDVRWSTTFQSTDGASLNDALEQWCQNRGRARAAGVLARQAIARWSTLDAAARIAEAVVAEVTRG
jgi:glycosyltransferase involved in cell wall biosynthesis